MNTMKLDLIQKILDKEGHDWHCSQCQYFHRWEERHPYGETYATETLCECRVETETDAEDCIRVQIFLEEEDE